MNIITKAYVAPPVTAQNNPPVSFLATIKKYWKNVRSIGNKLQLSSAQISKKTSWIFGLIVVVGIVLTVTVFYVPELKTTARATAPANQDVADILTKAKYTLNKGHVVKALTLYLQLAKQGNADAQFHAGLIYANGQGITKDDKQAVDWFAKAAEQGHIEAQTKLGFMYATGKGVAQNYNSAVYWCYKAAEQGDGIAQYNLGLMYAKGQGVAQDNSLAVSWYSKAAAQGHAHAQYNLGEMYANGVGVAKDNKQASVLYHKAAKQGLAEAVAALKKIESGE
jgi:TPR repeat protein